MLGKVNILYEPVDLTNDCKENAHCTEFKIFSVLNMYHYAMTLSSI